MDSGNKPSEHTQPESAAAWSPFRQPVFRALWIANVLSNIGTWIQNTATAWLMTSLTTSATLVALVQATTTLPIFLLALPAGALADVMDRRRLLLTTQGWMLLAAAALGVLTMLDRITPWNLLAFTLLIGLGTAMNAPAWQAIVPELVPRLEIPAAVALNSAGFNMARSVGPALGGLLVSMAGAETAFLINAASYLGVMLVLYWWKRPKSTSALPAESLLSAMRVGLRYVRHAPALRSILIRSAAFTVCASALMALLPLLARHELGLTAVGYGLLLASFGVGAVIGAALLPELKRKASVDLLTALCVLGFAAVMAATALVHQFAILCGALMISGVAWLVLLSTFNSSIQANVPGWVRGRAMAVYLFTFFGGMATGSILWGAVASWSSVPRALLLAAAGLAAGLPLTLRYRISGEDMPDFTPSMHWSLPSMAVSPRPEEGPILITVEYNIDPQRARDFERAIRYRRNARLRDGAVRWTLFVDAVNPRRYLESFIVESWVEHLRQHERVTMADREIEALVRTFHSGDTPPVVTHYLARALPEEAD